MLAYVDNDPYGLISTMISSQILTLCYLRRSLYIIAMYICHCNDIMDYELVDQRCTDIYAALWVVGIYRQGMPVTSFLTVSVSAWIIN